MPKPAESLWDYDRRKFISDLFARLTVGLVALLTLATTQTMRFGLRIMVTTFRRWRCVCGNNDRPHALMNCGIRPLRYSSPSGQRINLQAFAPIASLRTMFGRRPTKSPWTEPLTGAFLAIAALPMALALGFASGSSPQQGVATAMIAAALLAVLGGNGAWFAGPTVIAAVVAFDVIQRFGGGGLLLCTLITGGVLTALGWSRLGRSLAFIPSSFFCGIASAAAALMVIRQLPDLLGLSGNLPITNVFGIRAMASSLGNVGWATIAIATLAVALMVGCRLLHVGAIASVLALIVATVVGRLMDLSVDTIGSRFGLQNAQHTGLVVPILPFEHIQEILPTAIALALLLGTESSLAARIVTNINCERDHTDRDLINQGAINIIGPLIGCLPAGVSLSNTAENIRDGSRTPVGGLVYASVMMIFLIIGSWFIAFVPVCALASVLVVLAYDLFAWQSFRDLNRMGRWNAVILTVTFAIGITMNLTAAALVGVVVAAVALAKCSRQGIDVFKLDGHWHCPNNDSQAISPIAIYRPIAELPTNVQVIDLTDSFCDSLAAHLRASKRALPKVIILRFGQIGEINATDRSALREFHQACQSSGIQLVLAELRSRSMATLQAWEIADSIGKQNICATFEQAVARARIMADAGRTETCEP
jgi:SulP family sulfate permease